MPPNDAALETAILAAHADRNAMRLAALYEQAANAADCVDAECFFLTYAYVFALEAGAPAAAHLHARLKAHGREQ